MKDSVQVRDATLVVARGGPQALGLRNKPDQTKQKQNFEAIQQYSEIGPLHTSPNELQKQSMDIGNDPQVCKLNIETESNAADLDPLCTTPDQFQIHRMDTSANYFEAAINDELFNNDNQVQIPQVEAESNQNLEQGQNEVRTESNADLDPLCTTPDQFQIHRMDTSANYFEAAINDELFNNDNQVQIPQVEAESNQNLEQGQNFINDPIQVDPASANGNQALYIESRNNPRQIRNINRQPSRTRQPREWKIERHVHDIPDFNTPIQPTSTYTHKTDPLVVFKEFFPEYLIEILKEQTNRYALQKKSKNWQPTTCEEIKAYLGILIMMGLNPLPDMELYWAVDPFYNNPEISKCMTCKRFKKITENLHINDNTTEPAKDSPDYDKLYKVRPFITELNKIYNDAMGNSSVQSIDECMVKFKGRSSLKQYMPKKPIKRGFKVWARCDASSGYLYQFQVYTGKGENVEDEGLGYNVVMQLCSDLPENTLIAFDNFFTSCNLLDDLYHMKIFAVGTVRTNRKDLPNIMQRAQPKNLKLQKHQFTSITAKPITAIKWLDTRDVTVLTTAHHPTDVLYVKRTQKDGSKQPVLCPKAIADYTLSMGGVNRFDHFRSSYPINRKSRKFWMRLFFFMFDTSIINAYITYNTCHVINGHSHRNFRLRLARGLIGNYSTKKNRTVVFKNKGSRYGVPDEIRLFNVGVHLPDEGNTYKRCRLCSTKKQEKRTKIVCSTCQVALCPQKCFKSFHLAEPQNQ